jgi:hypothetical protein
MPQPLARPGPCLQLRPIVVVPLPGTIAPNPASNTCDTSGTSQCTSSHVGWQNLPNVQDGAGPMLSQFSMAVHPMCPMLAHVRRLGSPRLRAARHLGLPTWDGHPLKYTGTSLLVVLLQAPLKQCLCCHGQLDQVLLEDIVHTSCRTHSVSLLHHLLSHRGSMSAFGWSLLQVPSSSSTARAVGLYSYVPHVC